MTNKNNKIENFKKSISSTLKAISENKNLNINFGNNTDDKDLNEITLPFPSVQLEDMEKNEKEASVVQRRGVWLAQDVKKNQILKRFGNPNRC